MVWPAEASSLQTRTSSRTMSGARPSKGSSSRMTSGRASGRARWRASAGALEIITALTPNSVLEQELDESGGAVPALAAAGFEARVELVDERRDRQGGAALPRLVEADAHVLAHP